MRMSENNNNNNSDNPLTSHRTDGVKKKPIESLPSPIPNSSSGQHFLYPKKHLRKLKG